MPLKTNAICFHKKKKKFALYQESNSMLSEHPNMQTFTIVLISLSRFGDHLLNT